MKYDYSKNTVKAQYNGIIKNRIGIKYGMLAPQNIIEDNNTIYWRCRCDCGNYKNVKPSNMFRTKSCGCAGREKLRSSKFLDLTDCKFGRLLVICLNGKNENGDYVWKCRCDCGKIKYVITEMLRGGVTKSCGCLRSESSSKIHSTDYTGIKFKEFTVLYPTGKTFNGHKQWACQCSCGKIELLTSANILAKSPYACPECNRLHMRQMFYIDEAGNKYGKLTVIKIDENSKPKLLKWKCACECGSVVSVVGRALRFGSVTSCGCVKSNGEYAIASYLKENNIRFIREYKFDECKNKRRLPFDFYLPDYNTCIEFDGEQHYFPVDFSGNGDAWAKSQYDRIRRNDKIKTEFCNENNISLYRFNKETLCDIDKFINIRSLEKLHEEAN